MIPQNQNSIVIQPGSMPLPMQSVKMSDKKYFRKKFPPLAMKWLAFLQLAMGAVAILTQIIMLATTNRFYHYAENGTGIWTGLPFVATGIVGLVGAHQPSKCTIVAFMVLSIVSSVLCIPLIVMAPISMSVFRWHDQLTSAAMCAIQIVIAFFEAIVAICSASYCCQAVCCGRRRQDADRAIVIYNPNNQNQTGDSAGANGNNPSPAFTVVPMINAATAANNNAFTLVPINQVSVPSVAKI